MVFVNINHSYDYRNDFSPDVRFLPIGSVALILDMTSHIHHKIISHKQSHYDGLVTDQIILCCVMIHR